MTARVVQFSDKSFPPDLAGRDVRRLGVPLSDFSTPLLAIDRDALDHNIHTLAAWVSERGMELMPHGKTTMAPALWKRQLDAGATGITVATGWQAEVALRAGVPVVQIASVCTDPNALRRIVEWLEQNPWQEVVCWADSQASIACLERQLPPGIRTGVLVELGGAGGRTGIRDVPGALALAEQVAASPALQLRGVAGYEGPFAHDRSPASLAAVRAFCGRLVALLALVRPLVAGAPWITAGGSAFFDLVADSFSDVSDARAILRCGAYVVHDSGFYRELSPLDLTRTPNQEHALWPAMRGYASVVSRPEPGLALLDAGKRDFPLDEGLPEPAAIARTLGGSEVPLEGVITALNDQHAFLRWGGSQVVEVGDVVRLGLSHPCTAFDKWRLVPLLDPATGTVVEAVETCF